MTDKKRVSKERYCANCGESLGVIETRFYDRMDTCGSLECDRAVHDAYENERQEAHDAIDDCYSGGW